MRTHFAAVTLSASLALAPAVAHPADDEVGLDMAASDTDQVYDQAPAEPPVAAADQTVYPAEPVDAAAEPAAPAGQGQWVRTEQYGWVWMPYGNAYTYLPPDGGEPNMYVYYPSYGWTWVIAPWLWGWGPAPFFGFGSCWSFGWWGHGFGRWDGFRGVHAGFHGRGVFHDGRWGGLRGVSPTRPRGVMPPRGVAPPRGGGVPSRGRVSSGGGFGFSGARPGHSQLAWGGGRPAMPRGGFASQGGFRAPAAPHFGGFGGGHGGGGHLSGGSHGGGSHGSGGGHSGGFHLGHH